MKKIIALLLSVSLLFVLCSCGQNSEKKIYGISYEATESDNPDDYTVYIQENGTYVPYLVLGYNNNRNIVLLRKHTLPVPMRISSEHSAYSESSIHKYLNSEFFNTIDPAIQPFIQTEHIFASAKDPDSYAQFKTDVIESKIFLLSATEANVLNNNIPFEGQALVFFNKPENKICFDEFGNKTTWWLRSPDISTQNRTVGMDTEGNLGVSESKALNGIRPAFCLSDSKLVIKIQLNDGTYVWTIKNNDIKHKMF